MSVVPNSGNGKITVPESAAAEVFRLRIPSNSKKITCLTAYDYPTGASFGRSGRGRVAGGRFAWRWWCWAMTARCRLRSTRCCITRGRCGAGREAGAGGGGHAVTAAITATCGVAAERDALCERSGRGSSEGGRRRAAAGIDCAADGSGNSGDGPCGVDAAIGERAWAGFACRGKRWMRRSNCCAMRVRWKRRERLRWCWKRCRESWRRRLRASCGFRRSGSARGRIATGKSW